MRYLEVVTLVKNKPAGELTLGEVSLLRETIESSPEIYQVLGGKEKVEAYLAEAPDVSGLTAEEIAETDLQDRISREMRSGFHRTFWPVACLVTLLLLVVGGWIYLFSLGAFSRWQAQLEGNQEQPVDGQQVDGKQEGAAEDPVTQAQALAEPGNGSDLQSAVNDQQPVASDEAVVADDQSENTDAVASQDDHVVQPLPSIHPVFEDEGSFVVVDPIGGQHTSQVTLDRDDNYTGRRSVRLVPGDRYHLALDRVIPIREEPERGEFRYLRFAFRKTGGGRACVELETQQREGGAVRYDAGQGPPSHGSARRVWGLELPDEWIVMTCDVFSDFGDLDVTALTLSAPEGEHALFDHIYVARTVEELNTISDAPTAESTNQRARRTLARDVLSIAEPSVVWFEADGQTGTGVVIGNQGYVLTCAHPLFALKRSITVHFPDGSTVRGTKAGIYRNADCGLLKLVKNIGGQGLEISAVDNPAPNSLHVGLSLKPGPDDGRVPASFIVENVQSSESTFSIDFDMEAAEPGGPLVDRDGRVVGIHIGKTDDGKIKFAKLSEVRAQWDRLTRSEVWGQWPPGTGPMIGVVTTAIEEGSRIDHIMPGSTADKIDVQVGDIIKKVNGRAVRSYLDIGREIAEFDPNDLVEFQISRGDKIRDKRIRLMHRQEFPLP